MSDKIQNLRDFTVQIRRLTDNKVVGTGIAVSTDGGIVTCAHVVKSALGKHPRQANGGEMGVYFPQARAGDETGLDTTEWPVLPEPHQPVVRFHRRKPGLETRSHAPPYPGRSNPKLCHHGSRPASD